MEKHFVDQLDHIILLGDKSPESVYTRYVVNTYGVSTNHFEQLTKPENELIDTIRGRRRELEMPDYNSFAA